VNIFIGLLDDGVEAFARAEIKDLADQLVAKGALAPGKEQLMIDGCLTAFAAVLKLCEMPKKA
jgi:hypothetical protein